MADTLKSPSELKVPEGFRRKLRQYLNLLATHKVKQAHVARWAGVSEAQVSGWLAGDRSIGRAEVCRLAWAFAGVFLLQRKGAKQSGNGRPRKLDDSEVDDLMSSFEFKEKPEIDFPLPVENLDWFVNDFLQAAGYSPLPNELNRRWASLQPRSQIDKDFPDGLPDPQAFAGTLRVGYFPYSPFINEGADDDVARKITDKIAGLLGLRTSYVRIDRISEIALMLRRGEIDVTVPFMYRLPERQRHFQFSMPLPRVRVGLNLLVRRDYLVDLSGKTNEPVPSSRQLKSKSFSLLYTVGEAASVLLEYSEFSPDRFDREPQSKLDWSRIREGERDPRGKPYCYLLDEATCISVEQATKEDKFPLARVLLTPPPIFLTAHFCASPLEPKLIDAFDSGISFLHQTGFMVEVLLKAFQSPFDSLVDEGRSLDSGAVLHELYSLSTRLVSDAITLRSVGRITTATKHIENVKDFAKKVANIRDGGDIRLSDLVTLRREGAELARESDALLVEAISKEAPHGK
jgi:hypothetical protein